MLLFADLGGRRGAWQRDGDTDLIVLDVSLSRRERRAVLAHELVHAERGVGHPAPPSLMAREEELVRREVARRLVPPEELRALAAAAVEPVDVAAVCDAFDVPPDVALLAVRLLRPSPAEEVDT